MPFLDGLEARLLKLTQVSAATAGTVVAAAIVYLLISRGLTVVQHRKHLPEQLVQTFRLIARWGVGLLSAIVLLQSLDVLHSVFAAVTGLLALVAIGFVAVWSVLSNTLCSLILMIVRPFRVGDTLSLPPDELKGRVVNFNMLFTTLETSDGLTLHVPNNMFFQRPVLRKKGAQQVCLTDQLYRAENATFEKSHPDLHIVRESRAA